MLVTIVVYTDLYRWEEYDPLGEPVSGTRFISFKVPLKEVSCIQDCKFNGVACVTLAGS